MIQVKSICGLCKCDCGLIALIDGDRLAGLEGDPACSLNQGALCAKGKALGQLAYDPDRVLEPMRRRKSGQWEKASWSVIIDEIAARLGTLQQKYGASCVALYEGTIAKINTSWINKDFIHGLGSPNYTSVYSLCVSPREISSAAIFGQKMIPICDFPRAKFILLIGANPAASQMHRYLRISNDILNAKENGAKLIVVDPRYTETARKADLWIPIKPGTDLVFVLGLLHVIINEELYDAPFVSRHCNNFEQLREAVASFRPALVSNYTGIPAATVVAVARSYAAAKPACVDRREGVMHQRQATLINWAISVLAAVCGNVDVPGGLLFRPDFPLAAPRPAPQGTPHFARGKYSFANAAACLPETILSGSPYPIKALITVMGNPVTAWPNTKKVLSALEQLELLVCIDIYFNEVARRAHYFLPGVTCLERYALSYSKHMPLNLVRVGRPVINPLGNARPEDEIICALGKQLGIAGYQELNSQLDIIDKILRPSGYTAAEILAHPNGVIYVEMQPGGHLTRGFPTPSGKIELYPDNLGLPPSVPVRSMDDGNGAYPYYLVAGFRLPEYYHSTLMNLPRLRALYPAHQAEIAPDIAREKGIQDGDLIAITTPQGTVKLPARVAAASCPGVIAVPHGFGGRHGRTVKQVGGANVNYLTGDVLDPISATPAYRELRCNVTKLPAPPRLRLRKERCIACSACVSACQEKNNLPPGVSYLWLSGTAGRKDLTVCRQCANPRCVAACRHGAWKRRGRVLVAVPELCTGCRNCLEVCPYRAIVFHAETATVGKCSLCITLEEGSAQGPPACVQACPVGALYIE